MSLTRVLINLVGFFILLDGCLGVTSPDVSKMLMIKIAEKVKGKDPITLHIVYKIMADEVEHEEDLEAIMDDLEAMKKHFK